VHAWMEIVFFNAVAATVLALPIALVGRRFGRPALLHALWLLVLLRLIAPPAFEFGFVPRGETLPKLLSQSSPARTLDAATALDGAYGAHAVATPAQRGLSAEGSQQVAPPSETRGLLSATRPSGIPVGRCGHSFFPRSVSHPPRSLSAASARRVRRLSRVAAASDWACGDFRDQARPPHPRSDGQNSPLTQARTGPMRDPHSRGASHAPSRG